MNLEDNDVKNSDNFCLKWSNYQDHVQGVLVQLLETESLVDVTLCSSSGDKLAAHKIVLCAASSYFEAMFIDVGDNHPLVILSDVETSVLKCILDFVYHGELNVHAAHLNEVLQVAATLQIRGLTEVSDQLPLLVSCDVQCPILTEQGDILSSPGPDEGFTDFQETTASVADCSDADTLLETGLKNALEKSNFYKKSDESNQRSCSNNSEVNGKPIISEESFSVMDETNWTIASTKVDNARRKRKRRESCRKEYSEDQLAAALSDLRNGQLLRETAMAHKVPRSTLYVRAKAEGIAIAMTRKGHSGENVDAAVQAVKTGSSLQQASELYQIPKTVLWRRVKAIGAGVGRLPFRRQMYNSQHWQQAVQALQDGQNLSKVSALFQIPKTTLFREKTRLVEAGKLPWNSLKRKDPQSHSVNNVRLKEAVNACKDGKMSQAVASITYQVPKTTIWRRLQKGMQQAAKQEQSDKNITSIAVSNTMDHSSVTESVPVQNQSQFTFIENNSQLPVTYIVEEDFSSASLIV